MIRRAHWNTVRDLTADAIRALRAGDIDEGRRLIYAAADATAPQYLHVRGLRRFEPMDHFGWALTSLNEHHHPQTAQYAITSLMAVIDAIPASRNSHPIA